MRSVWCVSRKAGLSTHPSEYPSAWYCPYALIPYSMPALTNALKVHHQYHARDHKFPSLPKCSLLRGIGERLSALLVMLYKVDLRKSLKLATCILKEPECTRDNRQPEATANWCAVCLCKPDRQLNRPAAPPMTLTYSSHAYTQAQQASYRCNRRGKGLTLHGYPLSETRRKFSYQSDCLVVYCVRVQVGLNKGEGEAYREKPKSAYTA